MGFIVTLSYLLTFAVFLAVDMLWLGIIAKDLYQKYLGEFMSDKVNWTAAFIFYSIYVVGISIFAIYPAVQKGSVSHAIISIAAGSYWQIVGSIVMTLLLVKVSGVALLEKTLTNTKPQYREYIQKTNSFFPWFPKK
ncbi:MAG: DUF2177 family protein [Bacteroidales bacterium]|nr:DUF2177 family protein [Bacteroidales bacterium]